MSPTGSRCMSYVPFTSRWPPMPSWRHPWRRPRRPSLPRRPIWPRRSSLPWRPIWPRRPSLLSIWWPTGPRQPQKRRQQRRRRWRLRSWSRQLLPRKWPSPPPPSRLSRCPWPLRKPRQHLQPEEPPRRLRRRAGHRPHPPSRCGDPSRRLWRPNRRQPSVLLASPRGLSGREERQQAAAGKGPSDCRKRTR